MRVVVLVAERLPLSYVGCYGSDWVATPALDRLAAEAVVFDQHFATEPDAAGARRAWRSGRYHFPGADPAAEGPVDLLDLLGKAGVATHLVLDDSRPVPDEFTSFWQHVERVPAKRSSLKRVVSAAR